jgi:hypothetical protein
MARSQCDKPVVDFYFYFLGSYLVILMVILFLDKIGDFFGFLAFLLV